MVEILSNIGQILASIGEAILGGFKALFYALEAIFMVAPTVGEVASIMSADNWFVGAGLILGLSFVLARFLLSLL